MTLAELKALRIRQMVLWDSPDLTPPIVGEVIYRDDRSVEIHLDDGTNLVIWFSHVESLRDARVVHLRVAPAAPARVRIVS